MQARKERFINQIKNELALSGAQELINVRGINNAHSHSHT